MLAKLKLSRKGALAAALMWCAGAIMLIAARQYADPLQSMTLLCLLALLAAIDIERFVLPNELTLALIVSGIGFGVASGWDETLSRIGGAILGYAALFLIGIMYRSLRGRDGLGGGDAKLLAGGGAWVGAATLPGVVLVGSVAGLLFAVWLAVRRRLLGGDMAIPFGPFLGLGIWVVWCWK